MRSALIFLCALLLCTPHAHAQRAASGSVAGRDETEKAQVLEVIGDSIKTVPGTDTSHEYQTLKVKIIAGSEQGKVVTIENDYLGLKPGDVFFLTHSASVDGSELYIPSDPDRLPALGMLFVLFLIAVIAIGGWTGLRGLLALAASLFLIAYALLPGILAGYDPTLIAAGVASLIIVFGSYVTHGFNRTTSAAVLGMVGTILVTALFAHLSIAWTQLSGFNDESSVYLNFATRGHIDFVGLLLGSMLIGILGILYDAAIGQAVAVEELLRAAPMAARAHIFKRAMRIGREHIGALVNTLAIAYVGVALPLLLLFQSYGDESILLTINRELFATEIVRALVGSIGIVLAVPVTTAVAIFLLTQVTSRENPASSHGHHHA